MNRLYVIVQTNKSQYSEREMITRNSEREVLRYIGVISSSSGLEDDIELDRIFSVNEYGNVEHYDVGFVRGKLTLEAIPSEGR